MSQTAVRILAIHTCLEDIRPLPAYLAARVAQNLLQIDNAPTLHAAAAALVLARPAYDALLVDAEILARRHVEMLRLIQRHVSLPLWFFPATRGYGPSPEALPPGALPADQAVRALEHSRVDASTHEASQSRKENFAALPAPQTAPAGIPLTPLCPSDDAASPDIASEAVQTAVNAVAGASENVAGVRPEKRLEILVAQAVAPGYDAQIKAAHPPIAIAEPLLSEPEIRALLGSPE